MIKREIETEILESHYRSLLLADSSLGESSNNATPLAVKGILAGGITSILECFISYPLEYTKTQIQLQKHGLSRQKEIFKTMKHTIETRGITGLYRGFFIVALFTIPRESMRFGVYEHFKDQITDKYNGHFPISYSFLCGMIAGATEAIFASTPSETIKIKFIRDNLSKHPKYQDMFAKSILEFIRKTGIRGLYRGLTPNIIKQGSNQAIRFYIVESLKLRYHGGDPTKTVPSPMVGLFGMLGGVTSVLANHPIDVVKTRMQGYGLVKYKNTVDCFIKVYKEEGLYGFASGIKPRSLRVVLDAGLTFMFYDAISNVFTDLFNFD